MESFFVITFDQTYRTKTEIIEKVYGIGRDLH